MDYRQFHTLMQPSHIDDFATLRRQLVNELLYDSLRESGENSA